MGSLLSLSFFVLRKNKFKNGNKTKTLFCLKKTQEIKNYLSKIVERLF